MEKLEPGRRHFLHRMGAVGALGLPFVNGALSVSARAQSVPKGAYDPAARLEIKVSEVEFRRTAAGRSLMA